MVETRETHEIHTSERTSFKCKQRWDWGYREGLEPTIGIKPLEFGIAFHKALEAFYEPSTWDTLSLSEKYETSRQAMEVCIISQQEKYLKATGQVDLSTAFDDDYLDRISLASKMLRHYAFKVHPIADKGYRPVKVEVPFRVPLYDPNDLTEPIYCDSSPICGQYHPNPAPITLDGRVDAIFQEIQTGGYWLVDHKTATSLMSNDDWLYKDDQLSSYAIALQLMLGIDIKGFIYNQIRKDYPKPLKLLDRRNKGRLLSTNKTFLTDYETALASIKKDDPNGYESHAYDDYLEMLCGPEAPKFHKRFYIPQSNKKLAKIHSIISKEALDMVDPNIRIYPQTSKSMCDWCQFRTPCDSMMEGENYQHALNTLYRKKE